MHTLPNLPNETTREIYASLCSLLPSPPTDTPESRANRANAAMAAVIALHPANAFEADIATNIVGALAHARECFRVAALPGQDGKEAHRHRAQASAMMRQALGLLRALQALRPQQAKPKPPSQDQHREPPPPLPAPTHLTEVEKYAVTYPDRAARIRAAGRLPEPLDFDPPRHSLVRAIVSSTSPLLRELDQPALAAA